MRSSTRRCRNMRCWVLNMATRWQTSPFLHKAFVNENLRNKPKQYSMNNNKRKVLSHVVSTGRAVATEYYNAPYGYANSSNPDSAFLANLRGFQAGLETPCKIRYCCSSSLAASQARSSLTHLLFFFSLKRSRRSHDRSIHSHF